MHNDGAEVLEFDMRSDAAQSRNRQPPARLVNRSIGSSNCRSYLRPSCQNTLRAAMEFCVEDTSMPFAIPPLAASMFALCATSGEGAVRLVAHETCRLCQDPVNKQFFVGNDLHLTFRTAIDVHGEELENALSGSSSDDAGTHASAIAHGHKLSLIPMCIRVHLLVAEAKDFRKALAYAITRNGRRTSTTRLLLSYVDKITMNDLEELVCHGRGPTASLDLLFDSLQQNPEKIGITVRFPALLDAAIRSSDCAMIEALLKHKALTHLDVNMRLDQKEVRPVAHSLGRHKQWLRPKTPLGRALVLKVDELVIQLLLDLGANVSDRDDGYTPLGLAAVRAGFSERVLSKLVSAGSDVNAPMNLTDDTTPIALHPLCPRVLKESAHTLRKIGKK